MKIKVVRVARELVSNWLITGSVVAGAKCLDGLPEGAELFDAWFSGERQELVLVFRHDSFPDVDDLTFRWARETDEGFANYRRGSPLPDVRPLFRAWPEGSPKEVA